MRKLDLTKIREILMNEQIALSADIQNQQGKLQQNTEENQDLSDLADKQHQQKVAVSWLSLRNQRLTQVQAALKRLDEGMYGICTRCRNEINFARLRAIPYAALCVNCQERLERVR